MNAFICSGIFALSIGLCAYMERNSDREVPTIKAPAPPPSEPKHEEEPVYEDWEEIET